MTAYPSVACTTNHNPSMALAQSISTDSMHVYNLLSYPDRNPKWNEPTPAQHLKLKEEKDALDKMRVQLSLEILALRDIIDLRAMLEEGDYVWNDAATKTILQEEELQYRAALNGETIQQMIIRTQQEINMKERELQIKIIAQEASSLISDHTSPFMRLLSLSRIEFATGMPASEFSGHWSFFQDDEDDDDDTEEESTE